jgi:hypothetical protein
MSIVFGDKNELELAPNLPEYRGFSFIVFTRILPDINRPESRQQYDYLRVNKAPGGPG